MATSTPLSPAQREPERVRREPEGGVGPAHEVEHPGHLVADLVDRAEHVGIVE